MAAVVVKFEKGPITFQAGAPVLGGRFVKPDGAGKVIHATSLAKNVLGVAQTDAGATGLTHDGVNITTVHSPSEVAVIMFGAVRVEFTQDCAFGDLVVAGANGMVIPYVSGTHTYDQILGRCIEPGGVDFVSGSARGLVFVGLK